MTPKTFRHPGTLAFSTLFFLFSFSAQVNAKSVQAFAPPSSCDNAFREASTTFSVTAGDDSEDGRRGLPRELPAPTDPTADFGRAHFSPFDMPTKLRLTNPDPQPKPDASFDGSGSTGEMLVPELFGKVAEIYTAGALSVVARVENDGEETVVKIIKPASSPKEREREKNILRQEFDFLRRLHAGDNENFTAPVVRAISYDERGAMRLEVIHSTLDQHLAEISKKKPQEILKILRKIAVAIKHVHDTGLVHRDLKPTNIGFDKDGNVRLLDFGLSGEAGVPLKYVMPQSGSPGFMSDNAYRGGDPVPPDDWHSFHLLAQIAITGKRVAEDSDAKTRIAVGAAAGIKELKSSLATTKKVKEVMSILAWHTFKSGDDEIEAIDKASELINRPGKFFQEYFGPKYLETEPDIRKLVHEIFTAKELSSRFIKGKLGLSQEKIDLILDEVEKIQSNKPGSSTDSPLRYELEDGGYGFAAAAPHRSDTSSLDGEAIRAALAARNRRPRWERILHLPKSIFDKLRLRAPAEPPEPSL